MKFYRQPLSEEFFYSSPEKPAGNSYRWVANAPDGATLRPQIQREVRGVAKKRS
jgi:hypothetical protein